MMVDVHDTRSRFRKNQTIQKIQLIQTIQITWVHDNHERRFPYWKDEPCDKHKSIGYGLISSLCVSILIVLLAIGWVGCAEKKKEEIKEDPREALQYIPQLPPLSYHIHSEFLTFLKELQYTNQKLWLRKLIPAFSKTIDWRLTLELLENKPEPNREPSSEKEDAKTEPSKPTPRLYFGQKEKWSNTEPKLNVRDVENLDVLEQVLYEAFLEPQFTVFLYEQPIKALIGNDTDPPPMTTVRLGRLYWKDFITYSFEVNPRKKKAVEKYASRKLYGINEPLYDIDAKPGRWDEEWDADPELYPQTLIKKVKIVLDEPIRDLMRDLEKNYIRNFQVHQYMAIMMLSASELPDYPWEADLETYAQYLYMLKEGTEDYKDQLSNRTLIALIYSDEQGELKLDPGKDIPVDHESGDK